MIKNKRTLPIVPTAILLGTLFISSVQALEISLQDAFQLAIEHSHRLKQAEAERQASQSALRSARATRLPDFSVQGRAFYNDEVASLDISVPPNFNLSRKIGSKENYQTDLRLALPLFTGGKISSGIQSADAILDLSRALEQVDLEELYYRTRIEYLQVYKTSQLLEAAQASLDRATIIERDVNSQFQAGIADSVDVLETSFAFTKAFLKVEEARTARRSSGIRLAMLINLPPGESMILTDTPSTPLGRGVYYTSVTRAELRAGKALVDVSQARVKMTRAAYLPSLSAYVGYSYGKPNLDLFNKTWMDYFTVGASATWSLNLGGRKRHEVQRAHYQHQAAQREYDALTERLERNAKLALEQVKLARHRYDTAKLHKRTSTDNYRLAKRMQGQGALSLNRLLEIEANLSEAEAELAAAVADYHIAEATYYYALGSDELKEGF